MNAPSIAEPETTVRSLRQGYLHVAGADPAETLDFSAAREILQEARHENHR